MGGWVSVVGDEVIARTYDEDIIWVGGCPDNGGMPSMPK